MSKLHQSPPFKSDHVGSFLRPKSVLEARAQHQSGKISDAELRKVEDTAIEHHVKQLLKNDVKAITDGEFRRQYFHIDFLKLLDGVTLESNTLEQDQGHKPPTMKITGKVVNSRKGIEVENFKFLKSLVPSEEHNRIKITIPSPTTLMRGGRLNVSEEVYPSLEEFYKDLAECYRVEIAALYEAGCRYIQIDNTDSAYLTDPSTRESMKSKGQDPDKELAAQVALINASIANKPSDLTIATHLCKGNFKSTFFAQGDESGYAPIAKHFFSDLNVDAFFLEWEDEQRSGKDFSALAHLPEGKSVVLGLVSSKIAKLEDKEVLIKKVNEAAKVVPLGLKQLAISPQCGFSSTVHGNEVTEEDQYAKLRLCNEVAKAVWGDSSA